jgi:YD repeat-containing protein
MKQIYFLMIAMTLAVMQVNAGSVITDSDLDSIVSHSNGLISYKNVYQRDGNTISGYEFYYWQTQTNELARGNKMVYEYDGGRLSKITSLYQWDAAQNAYVEDPSWKTEYHYDAQGKELYEVSYDWSYLGVWEPEPYSKTEYQYDGAGKIIFSYVYSGDGTTSLVNPSSKHEYQYDAQDYLINIIEYSWSESSNDWVKSEEYIYHNDSEGKCTSYERYCGQIVTSTIGMVTISVNYWGLFSRTTHEYDALGRVKQINTHRIIYEAKGQNDVVDTGRTDTQSNTYYYRNKTGIKVVSLDNAKIIGYYSITGQKLAEEPQSGLYIIQYDNGTAEKKLKNYRPF